MSTCNDSQQHTAHLLHSTGFEAFILIPTPDEPSIFGKAVGVDDDDDLRGLVPRQKLYNGARVHHASLDAGDDVPCCGAIKHNV